MFKEVKMQNILKRILNFIPSADIKAMLRKFKTSACND